MNGNGGKGLSEISLAQGICKIWMGEKRLKERVSISSDIPKPSGRGQGTKAKGQGSRDKGQVQKGMGQVPRSQG